VKGSQFKATQLEVGCSKPNSGSSAFLQGFIVREIEEIEMFNGGVK
jgi:hypothetical protein